MKVISKTETPLNPKDLGYDLEPLRFHRDWLTLERDILQLQLEIKHYQDILNGSISSEEEDGE